MRHTCTLTVLLLALLASMGAQASTVSGRLADLDDPVSRLDFAERMAADATLVPPSAGATS